MKVYNKGKRSFQLSNGSTLKAGQTLEVADVDAQALVKGYPKEVISFEQGRNTEGVREEIAALEATVKALKAENESLKEAAAKQDEALLEAGKAHKQALEALQAEIDTLTTPAADQASDVE